MKRVLVLGATSGIGRALVELLREKGYEAIAAGRRAEALAEIGGEGLQLDVTAPDAIERIARVGADTVIYNAGFGEQTQEPDWGRTEQTLKVNVVAFERVAQWAVEHCACFVATASIAGLRGLEDTNGYSASKAYMINAMEGYRRRVRLRASRCRVVTLMPGFVDTAMGQASSFWRCSTRAAACCILKGLERGQRIVYVTPRWRWVALLLRSLPGWLFERIRVQ